MNEQTNKSRKVTRPAHSLFALLQKKTGIDRAVLKAEWKACEDGCVFTLPSVNALFDRKITFHLQNLTLPYSLFDQTSYQSVLDYVSIMDKQHTFNFNDIIALYNEPDNTTIFGFSPVHKTIAIDVKKKLLVSPHLPYE